MNERSRQLESTYGLSSRPDGTSVLISNIGSGDTNTLPTSMNEFLVNTS